MLSPRFKSSVTKVLGERWIAYIERKKIGGDNGQKGVRFEDFFAAYRLAEELSNRLASPSNPTPFMALQAEAIVDDLVVTWGNSKATYYQCKNVAKISWSSGTHPLADDFRAQYLLSSHLNQTDIRTAIVVPTEELSRTLACSTPSEISHHTDVLCFPYCDGKFNRLVLENSQLRDLLIKLSRVADPANDELVNVFGALLHGILSNNGRGDCDQLFLGAQSLSPHLIRLMPDQLADFKVLDGFETTLAKVAGLMYRFSRGFFHWKAFGTSGVFHQNCLSQEFERFQRRVVECQPATFDEFEVLL